MVENVAISVAGLWLSGKASEYDTSQVEDPVLIAAPPHDVFWVRGFESLQSTFLIGILGLFVGGSARVD